MAVRPSVIYFFLAGFVFTVLYLLDLWITGTDLSQYVQIFAYIFFAMHFVFIYMYGRESKRMNMMRTR